MTLNPGILTLAVMPAITVFLLQVFATAVSPLPAGAALSDVCMYLYIHCSPQMTPLRLTPCDSQVIQCCTYSSPCSALFPQILCTTYTVNLLACCLFMAREFALCSTVSLAESLVIAGGVSGVLGTFSLIYSCDLLRFPEAC